MYSIHVYSENAQPIFKYESTILPHPGDQYVKNTVSPGHYEVVKRIIHTEEPYTHAISVWVKAV